MNSSIINTREKRVSKYGIEIIEHDEQIWLDRGYKVNPKSGLLEKTELKTHLSANQ